MPRENYCPWTPDDVTKLRELCDTPGMEAPDIAITLNRSVNSVRNKMQALAIHVTPKGRAPVSEPANPEEPEFASPYTDRPLSVADIVEMFAIDLTVWEPYQLTPNVWQMGAKHPDARALLEEDPDADVILKRDLFQTKVRFRRKPEATWGELRDALVADIVEESSRRRLVKPRLMLAAGSEPCALEVCLFDLHIGKYGWADETGTDYDSDLAERIATRAFSDLIHQARDYTVEEIILPFGNDFFHYDNPQGETTAGTAMDRDTRFQRMYRIGHRVASWMVERCAEVAPTTVLVVPGNHDTITAFTMGVVLEAEFRGDERVTFNNSPAPRKYHQYGKNLLGFAHGDKERPDFYAKLMPVEVPELWAATSCREFHLGHIHTAKKHEPLSIEDHQGVTLRWIRSLSGTDAWHAGKGFLGTRSAEGFLWRKAGGMRGHFVSLPVADLLNGRAA